MFSYITRLLRDKKGMLYVEATVAVMVIMMALALILNVAPVFIIKQQMNLFASQLCREAEMSGRVGTETAQKEQSLKNGMNINPNVTWSVSGNIRLNQEFTVNLSYTYDIGLFGGFASFPVTMRSKAVGRGEMYWK